MELLTFFGFSLGGVFICDESAFYLRAVQWIRLDLRSCGLIEPLPKLDTGTGTPD